MQVLGVLPGIPFEPGIPFALGFTLAALGAMILGIAKSGFGGGVGIVAMPMFAIAFGAQRGVAVLLPVIIVADVFSLTHHWGNWDKRVLRILAPGTLVGIAVGSVILWGLVVGWIWPWNYDWHLHLHGGSAAQRKSAEVLNVVTGLVCILYVILEQVRARLAPHWVFRPTHRVGFGAGTAFGMVSTLAHAAGPIGSIFMLNQGLSRAAYIGTIVIFAFSVNMLKLIPYNIIPGLMDRESMMTSAYFVIFAPLGTWLGVWMCRHISDKLFRNILLAAIFVTGVQLIMEYATGVKLAQAAAKWVTG